MDGHDGDADMENEELMKSLGFSSFGGPDNRPKHKLPRKPIQFATGANAEFQQQGGHKQVNVRERSDSSPQSQRGRGGGAIRNAPHKRQKINNSREGGQSRRNKWEGFEQGGSGDSEWFYSPRFVQDPWQEILGEPSEGFDFEPYTKSDAEDSPKPDDIQSS